MAVQTMSGAFSDLDGLMAKAKQMVSEMLLAHHTTLCCCISAHYVTLHHTPPVGQSSLYVPFTINS